MPQSAAYETVEPGRAFPEAARIESGTELAEHEKWLYDNPEALAAVKRGLADSAAGYGVKMSFLEFADIDADE